MQHVATALRIGAKQGVQKQSALVGVAVQQSPENGLRVGWVMLMQEQQVQQP